MAAAAVRGFCAVGVVVQVIESRSGHSSERMHLSGRSSEIIVRITAAELLLDEILGVDLVVYSLSCTG